MPYSGSSEMITAAVIMGAPSRVEKMGTGSLNRSTSPPSCMNSLTGASSTITGSMELDMAHWNRL